jgi:hypothetical protein
MGKASKPARSGRRKETWSIEGVSIRKISRFPAISILDGLDSLPADSDTRRKATRCALLGDIQLHSTPWNESKIKNAFVNVV